MRRRPMGIFGTARNLCKISLSSYGLYVLVTYCFIIPFALTRFLVYLA